jgi:hypothetical protein
MDRAERIVVLERRRAFEHHAPVFDLDKIKPDELHDRGRGQPALHHPLQQFETSHRRRSFGRHEPKLFSRLLVLRVHFRSPFT